MFEKIVSDLLLKYLGQYIKNLQAENLKIGIWGGDVKLDDLELNEDALRSFNLPFGIKRGRIGKLVLKIPWKSLKSQPVVVVVDDVFILASPEYSFAEYDPKKERENALKTKKAKLEQAEVMKSLKEQGGEEKKDDGFLTKLATKIVDNFQVEVNNVHIRFEDFESNKEYPFSFGICLKSLTARSTDENWKEMFIEDRVDKFMYKLAKMEHLSAYFDPITKPTNLENLNTVLSTLIATDKTAKKSGHHFLLEPISAYLKLRVDANLKPDFTKPKIYAELVFNSIGIQLEDLQYQTLLRLVSSIASYEKCKQYLKFRPLVPIKSKGGAKLWWQFAINAVLEEVRENVKRRSWKYMFERRKQRQKYVELYKRKQKVKWLPELKGKEVQELEKLEEDLSFEDVIFFRSLASAELKKEAQNQKELEEFQKKQPKKGWFGGWLGGSKSEDKDSPSVSISAEERQALYDTIEFSEVMEEIDLPKDYVKIQAGLQVNSVSLTLLGGHKDRAGDPIVFSCLQNVGVKALIRPDSVKANISIGSTFVEDKFTKDNRFPKMVSKATGQQDADLLKIEFEQNPLDKHADLVLILDALPLDIVLNKPCLEKIAQFFVPPKEAQLNDLKNKAFDSMNSISELTKAQLEDAVQNHKTMDIRVNIDAPMIIIPEDCTKKTSSLLVADLGKLAISSHLTPVDKTSFSKSRTEDDFYDKFNLSLTDIQVLLVPKNDLNWRSAAVQEEFYMHLVERFSITLRIYNTIQPNDINLTKLKVFGELPNLKVNFSPKKYGQIMRLVNSFTDMQPLQEEKVAEVYVEAASSTNKPIILEAQTNQPKEEISPHLVKRKLFEAQFRVVKIGLQVSRHNGSKEEPLVHVVVEGLDVHFTQRSYDIILKAALHSFSMEDCLQPADSEFRYLATSSLLDESEDSDLITLSFKQTQKISPEYKGVEGLADFTFNSFFVICNRDTVSALIEFVLQDLEKESPQKKSPAIEQTQPLTPRGGTSQTSSAPKQQKVKPVGDAKIQVNATLKTIALLLNRDGELFAEFSIRDFSASATVYQNTLKASGSLYDITVSNMKPSEGGEHYNKIFSIVRDQEEEPMLTFDIQTFNKQVEGYTGWDNQISAQMRSVRFIFLNTFVMALQSYFLDGPIMASLLAVTAAKAAESAKAGAAAATQVASHNKLNVVIRSPQIIVPQSSTTREFLSIDLGKLEISNSMYENEPLEDIHIALSQMNIQTARQGHKGEPNTREFLGLSFVTVYLLGNVGTNIKLTRVLSPTYQKEKKLPQFKVSIKVSKFEFQLSDLQLLLIAGILNGNMKEGSNQHKTLQEPAPEKGIEVDNKKQIQQKKLIPEVDESQAKDVNVTADLVLEFDGISFQITRGAGESAYSIATFHIGKLGILFHQMSDSSMDANITLQSIALQDTRPDSKSQFRKLVSYLENAEEEKEPQLQIVYSKTSQSDQDVKIQILHPTVFLVPEAIFAIKDFFMPGLEALQGNEGESKRADKPNPKSEPTPAPSVEQEGTLRAVVNIKDPRVLLIHTADRKDSRAVVVESSFMVEYSKSTTRTRENAPLETAEIAIVNVINFQAFVCQPNSQFDQPVPVAKPFNVDVSYLNNKSMEIQVDIMPVSLLFSYQDFKMVMDILNLMKPPPSEKESKAIELEPSPSPTVEKILKKAEEAVVRCPTLIVTLINDYQGRNIPLIETRVSSVMVSASNWSTGVQASLGFTLAIDYFNNSNVQFEPLLEYWSCQIKAKQSTNPKMQIEILSPEQLNLNITHSFIGTLGTIMEILHKDYYAKADSTELLEMEYTPYAVLNRAAVNLKFSSEAFAQDIAPGERVPFGEQQAPKKALPKNDIRYGSVTLDGFSAVTAIPLDKVGRYVYNIQDASNQTAKLVCDLMTIDGCKTLTVRSLTIVKNDTTIPLEICVMSSKDQTQPVHTIGPIAPGEYSSVPMALVKKGWIGVRPSTQENYHWSTNLLSLAELLALREDAIPKFEHCFSTPPSDKLPFYCILKFECEVFEDEREMTLHLKPPVIIDNYLPCDLECQLFEGTTPVNKSTILKGDSNAFHSLNPKCEIQLVVTLPTWDDCKMEVIHVPNTDRALPNVLTRKVTEKLQFKDSWGRNLILKIDSRIQDEGNRQVTIFSPYWVINNSGTEVQYRPSVIGTGKDETVWGGDGHKVDSSLSAPTLFSMGENALDINKGKIVVKMNNSKWSKPFSVDSLGAHGIVEMKHETKNYQFELGVSLYAGEGHYRRTKIIEFVPRHKLINESGVDLSFKEMEDQEHHLVAAGTGISFPYWKINKLDQKLLCLQPKHEPFNWSPAFSVDDLADFVLQVKAISGEDVLFRVIVEQEYATNIIKIKKQEKDSWPYLLENSSSFSIQYYQVNTAKDGLLQPGTSIGYVWPEPLNKHELVIEFKDAKMKPMSYHLDAIESFDPIVVNSKKVYLYTKASGPIRILCITEDKDKFVQETPKDTKEKGEAVTEVVEIDFKMVSKGIGISIVDTDPKELLFLSAIDLEVTFSQSNIDQKIGITLANLQLDNQLQDSYLPVMLGYVKKNPDQPFLAMTIVRSLENKSIDYITYFSVLVQEMNLKVDDAFITEILKFYKGLNLDPILKQQGGVIAPSITPTVSGAQLNNKAKTIFPKGKYYFTYCFYPAEVMSPIAEFEAADNFSSVTFTNLEPLKGYTKIFYISSDKETFRRIDALYARAHKQDESESKKFSTSFGEYGTVDPAEHPYNGLQINAPAEEEKNLYFKFFTLNPIKVNITFSITPQAHNTSNNPLRVVTQVLGSTFANLDNAPIRLNALAFHDAFSKKSDLQNRIISHYKGQAIREFYKILGSADFLGNPVGLFSNISNGVVDFFYEPASGLVESPQAFGKGLAKGSLSLVKNTTYGLFNTVSKLTGTVGKGVANLTFDDEYIEKRQIRQATEKPKHVGDGLLYGTRDLAKGLWEGTTGLVTQPVKGAKTGGILGFAKGIGKGLAGTVVKPVVGATDFVTKTTEGIRNTTTLGDFEHKRMRPPRAFDRGVLTAFTEKESLGVFTLRQLSQGAFRAETYKYHEELDGDLMMIVTQDRIIMAKMKSKTVAWTVRLKDVTGLTLTQKGVLAQLNHEPDNAIIYCTDNDKNMMMYTKLSSCIKTAKAHNKGQ